MARQKGGYITPRERERAIRKAKKMLGYFRMTGRIIFLLTLVFGGAAWAKGGGPVLGIGIMVAGAIVWGFFEWFASYTEKQLKKQPR